MSSTTEVILAFDVGEKRIGAARGDTAVRIASPLPALAMNDSAAETIRKLAETMAASTVVLGLPRNQSGEETKQTQYVREFAKKLEACGITPEFQDESLTSVIAERRLLDRGKKYDKAAIDSEAAAIILTDYLEQHFGN